eukprot:8543-Heterococcus_DN1.PRE.1
MALSSSEAAAALGTARTEEAAQQGVAACADIAESAATAVKSSTALAYDLEQEQQQTSTASGSPQSGNDWEVHCISQATAVGQQAQERSERRTKRQSDDSSLRSHKQSKHAKKETDLQRARPTTLDADDDDAANDAYEKFADNQSITVANIVRSAAVPLTRTRSSNKRSSPRLHNSSAVAAAQTPGSNFGHEQQPHEGTPLRRASRIAEKQQQQQQLQQRQQQQQQLSSSMREQRRLARAGA